MSIYIYAKKLQKKHCLYVTRVISPFCLRKLTRGGYIMYFIKQRLCQPEKKKTQAIQVACMLQGEGFPMKSQFAPWMIIFWAGKINIFRRLVVRYRWLGSQNQKGTIFIYFVSLQPQPHEMFYLCSH